jgi:hypothetical protein
MFLGELDFAFLHSVELSIMICLSQRPWDCYSWKVASQLAWRWCRDDLFVGEHVSWCPRFAFLHSVELFITIF